MRPRDKGSVKVGPRHEGGVKVAIDCTVVFVEPPQHLILNMVSSLATRELGVTLGTYA